MASVYQIFYHVPLYNTNHKPLIFWFSDGKSNSPVFYSSNESSTVCTLAMSPFELLSQKSSSIVGVLKSFIEVGFSLLNHVVATTARHAFISALLFFFLELNKT